MGYAFDFKVRELKNEPTLQYIRDSWLMAMAEMDSEQRATWEAIYDKKNEEFLKILRLERICFGGNINGM